MVRKQRRFVVIKLDDGDDRPFSVRLSNSFPKPSVLVFYPIQEKNPNQANTYAAAHSVKANVVNHYARSAVTGSSLADSLDRIFTHYNFHSISFG